MIDRLDHPSATWGREPYFFAARQRALARGAQGPMMLIEIDAHGQLRSHARPERRFYLCLAGEGHLWVGGEQRAFQRDDFWLIEAAQPHAIRSRGDERVRLLVAPLPAPPAISPARPGPLQQLRALLRLLPR